MKPKIKINYLMVKVLCLWLFCFNYFGVVAQKDPSSTFRNPVLGGDYPDPSILRDGDDYYMVHSSFEYYPACWFGILLI